VSPSLSIISIPIGLIAIASLIARHQDRSFQTGQHKSALESSVLLMHGSQSSVAELQPSQRLDHARYGVGESIGGTMLGRDIRPRQLGERSATAPDWLRDQTVPAARNASLPEISSYTASPPATDPLATPIAPESGYQITAEEVSRLDMDSGRVVFNKNVHMVSPQFDLTCNQLVVHLGKDKNSMQLSEAHGAVNILLTGVPPERAYRGQSSDATFDPNKDIVILTGWPKAKGVSQEQVAAEAGTRMTLYTKSGRLVTEGRAQTRVTRSFVNDSTGANKK
jgi:lipopolysaccharide transport protein LptA